MDSSAQYGIAAKHIAEHNMAMQPKLHIGNTAPVQADRDLGNILNDLLGQCKQVQSTIDELCTKLEPLLAPTPQPQDVDGVCPFVSTSANELAVNVERELISIRRRLRELVRTSSV